MRNEISLLVLFICILPLSINDRVPPREDLETTKRIVTALCGDPWRGVKMPQRGAVRMPQTGAAPMLYKGAAPMLYKGAVQTPPAALPDRGALKYSVRCLKTSKISDAFGKWKVKSGELGAVLFANIVPTKEVIVEELKLPKERTKRMKTVQLTPVPVTSEIEAVIKIEFGGLKLKKYMDEKLKFPSIDTDRSNYIILADFNMGPRVYQVTVLDKNSMSFGNFIVLERISGWTLRERFEVLIMEINNAKKRGDDDKALRLMRKFLHIQIVYLERLKELWERGYRHCDAHDENVMIKAIPMEECKEKPGRIVDVIGKKCVIWETDSLVLLDPSFLTKIGDPESVPCMIPTTDPQNVKVYQLTDLERALEFFRQRSGLVSSFPGVYLVEEMNKIIRAVPEGKLLRRRVEDRFYHHVHGGLVRLSKELAEP